MTKPPGEDRSHVLSEQPRTDFAALHEFSVAECLEAFDVVDREVMNALEFAQPALRGFIEALEERFRLGGRLIYLGAGTSGRLGVLDASECPPTFRLAPSRVVGLIAGGDGALRRSSEGKEDDPDGAVEALVGLKVSSQDTILGIAAGGTTPYVRGALRWCKKLSDAPLTALLTCSPIGEAEECDHVICAPTGPELLTGSTGLKAGTATKMILNRISTTLMIRTGRVYGNLMVDLKATNLKLVDRALRILMAAVSCDREEAEFYLHQADGHVKLAIVMARGGRSKAEALMELERSEGRLSEIL